MTDQAQRANGVSTCVSCGSSDVTFDGRALVCGYCRHRWNTAVLADELKLNEGIDTLVGTTALAGARHIDTSSLVTVECSGCGAAISINTATSLTAPCPWCRHTLSLNAPVANGAVPDAILPFFVTREDAAARMAAFTSTRTTYASADFLRDFATNPPQAVYLPYLVADGNVTVRLDGRGWVARGSSGSASDGDNQEFTTDVYAVTRECDVLVDDVAIEARTTRSRLAAAVSTSNIINAIQPFDVAHAVRFDPRYIAAGTVFERRDIDVPAALHEAASAFATIVRGYVAPSLSEFTGGVRWEHEQTCVKGTRWISVLLPVWLYAFQERTASGPMMHYIAVNGRTGDTEGSVPADKGAVAASSKQWGRRAGWIAAVVGGLPVVVNLVVSVLGALGGMWETFAFTFAVTGAVGGGWALASWGIGKLASSWRESFLTKRQRNPDARLRPELETSYTPTRLTPSSQYLGRLTHGGGPEIRWRNDHQHHVRATDSRITYGEAPVDPNAGTDQIADFAAQEARGSHLELDGSPVIGWHVTGPPPGYTQGLKDANMSAPLAADADASGWWIDMPLLNKRWAINRDGKFRRS